MKVDEETRTELIENFEKWLRGVNTDMNYYIEKIKEAETVEEIMKLKKNLLLEYLYNAPLDSTTCYFCIYNNEFCEFCSYAKTHGFCGDSDSDYRKIKSAFRKLVELIDKKYYSGEKYEE